MHHFADYGLFAAETFTFVVAILLTVAGIIALTSRDKSTGELNVRKLNERYEKLREILSKKVLNKKALKLWLKEQKQTKKAQSKLERKRIFVVEFSGDLRAKATANLRVEVTAILNIAKPSDEVVILIESPGGSVAGYGYAASQLQRLREAKIPITACVDKVAASGGYLMACVANRILAAPFAYIGSIGVVAQIPNFHRYLKDKNIDVDVLTAGEYKRTMTVFGENTEQGRKKFLEDLNLIHTDFKNFVKEHRPHLDIEKIATGEHWLATDALTHGLVDALQTSDDYLLSASNSADIYQIEFKTKTSKFDKITQAMEATLQSWMFR